MEQNNYEMIQPRWKSGVKIAFLVYHIIVIAGLSTAIALLLIPDAKLKLLGTPFGKFLIKTQITEENFQNIYDDDFEDEKVVKNDDIDTSSLDKYLNIALFGLDSRDKSLDRTNSDTIMIVSIDRDSKEVKLVSVYRDSYQQIYKDGEAIRYNKINSAYAVGGPEAAINTLNQNYDLDIEDYVAVNFNGIATIIDLLGGIDLNITDEERNYINGYLTETRKITDMDAEDIYEYGNVHLDGLQATAYCRIRYTKVYMEDGTSYNNDFGRTARQRIVLTQLLDKAKNAGLNKIMGLCEEVFKEENNIFRTSLSYEEVMDLIPIVLNFSMDSTIGYPFTYDDDVKINRSSNVVVAGHAYNVAKLHEFLFPSEKYEPSKMVMEIDAKLLNLTGVYTMLTDEDKLSGTSEYDRYLKQSYVRENYEDYYDSDYEDYDDEDYDDYDDDDDDDDDEYNDDDELRETEDMSKETESQTIQEEVTTKEQTTFKEEETTQEETTGILEETTKKNEHESESVTENNTDDNHTIGENKNEQNR